MSEVTQGLRAGRALVEKGLAVIRGPVGACIWNNMIGTPARVHALAAHLFAGSLRSASFEAFFMVMMPGHERDNLTTHTLSGIESLPATFESVYASRFSNC